jgi:RNA polymerase sigma factor (sigma-70 family)
LNKVRVGGRYVEESTLIDGISRGDPALLDALVLQVRNDRTRGGRRSPALEIVCTAFRTQVRRFLRGRYRLDEESLKEVWNDTLLRVYDRLEAFDPQRSALRTWVFNEAIFATRERLTEMKRQTRGDGLALEAGGRPNDPMATLMRDFDASAIRRAYLRLNHQQQKLLFLKHVLGCRHTEIARHRLAGELPEEHVRVYVNRASERLRDLYAQELASGAQPGHEPETELDELWAIESFAEQAKASGEYKDLACLAADAGAARLGRLLRWAFDPSLLDPELQALYADEIVKLASESTRNEEVDRLTDEEVEELLRTVASS